MIIKKRTLNKEIVEEIKKLAKEHRTRCNKDCGISLTFIGIGCQRLLKRKLTKEEWNYFI